MACNEHNFLCDEVEFCKSQAKVVGESFILERIARIEQEAARQEKGA